MEHPTQIAGSFAGNCKREGVLESFTRIKHEVDSITTATLNSIRETGNVGFLMAWLHIMLVTFAEAYI